MLDQCGQANGVFLSQQQRMPLLFRFDSSRSTPLGCGSTSIDFIKSLVLLLKCVLAIEGRPVLPRPIVSSNTGIPPRSVSIVGPTARVYHARRAWSIHLCTFHELASHPVPSVCHLRCICHANVVHPWRHASVQLPCKGHPSIISGLPSL